MDLELPKAAYSWLAFFASLLPGMASLTRIAINVNNWGQFAFSGKGGALARVNTLVVTGYGSNSQLETAHAARLAGSDQVDLGHFSDLVAGRVKISDYQFLIFPGGFLDGDHLGAGQVAAVRWRFMQNAEGKPLLDDLRDLLRRGGLILGICNGFQLLARLGVLPGFDGLEFHRSISLGPNDSGKFEDRWVGLLANPQSPCVFTRNLPSMRMPVRHGEGKVAASAETLERLRGENLIALQYVKPGTGEATLEYPANPNGSPLGIAGLCNPSGQVLGLMPHPEAFHHVANHPGWTRGELDAPGTLLFVNAVKYLQSI